jgi:RHS repeat-associated protein
MRYTGRFFDIVAQLQDNLRRKYDAAIARWASTDPIGFEAGDANLYRYVNNGPLWHVDPLGMAPNCKIATPNKIIPYTQWDVWAVGGFIETGLRAGATNTTLCR